ncbi:MAG: V-type ATP synthase subunit D [DPANN group archaeon]|nr:V-type ATP synthase subunit D [DPANN group archaeon]
MALDIKPTRSELIALKRRIKMARMGHQILKKKRDGLILSFFEILKKAKMARRELQEEYLHALKTMNICRMLETDAKLKGIALAISKMPTLDIQTKSVMGVIVPQVTTEGTTSKDVFERGYGVMGTSFVIDEAVSEYEKVIDRILTVAEVENAMKRLLEEIDKTKRRVNALEFEVIPKMQEAKAFITFRLEEMERETVFRTKKIKMKKDKIKRAERKAASAGT